ncbi:MAG: hypothetical protein M3540_06925 [Actinomycetota bacterium]|nr:hypothetical protein [Actinomycetota bacterium]
MKYQRKPWTTPNRRSNASRTPSAVRTVPVTAFKNPSDDGALQERADLGDEQCVRRQPDEAHGDEDSREQQRLRGGRVTGVAELWDQRRKNERDLRVQEVREQTLPKRRRLAPPRWASPR